MHNIGGGWPGAVAFAGLGQPGRYALCLAENEAQSPWAPLQPNSAVTVTRAESVINVTGGLAEESRASWARRPRASVSCGAAVRPC